MDIVAMTQIKIQMRILRLCRGHDLVQQLNTQQCSFTVFIPKLKIKSNYKHRDNNIILYKYSRIFRIKRAKNKTLKR